MRVDTQACPVCHQRRKRSVPQNSRYWKLVGQMSKRYPDFSKLAWHEYFKDLFLPKIEVFMPDWSTKLIPTSTSDLPMHKDPKNPELPNWDDYTMEVEVWCSERGVWLAE